MDKFGDVRIHSCQCSSKQKLLINKDNKKCNERIDFKKAGLFRHYKNTKCKKCNASKPFFYFYFFYFDYIVYCPILSDSRSNKEKRKKEKNIELVY